MKRNAFFFIGLFAAALLLMGFINPEQYHLFPRCPFLSLTGYQCPGCGSQRALHYLANGNLALASSFNFLLIPGIVYAGTGYLLSAFYPKSWTSVQSKWYGRKAAVVALLVIVGYWVGRNVF
jgi:hypothetical protein